MRLHITVWLLNTPATEFKPGQIAIRICVWSAIGLKANEKNFFRRLLMPGVASFLCLTRDDSLFLNQIEGWIYRGA